MLRRSIFLFVLMLFGFANTLSAGSVRITEVPLENGLRVFLEFQDPFAFAYVRASDGGMIDISLRTKLVEPTVYEWRRESDNSGEVNILLRAGGVTLRPKCKCYAEAFSLGGRFMVLDFVIEIEKEDELNDLKFKQKVIPNEGDPRNAFVSSHGISGNYLSISNWGEKFSNFSALHQRHFHSLPFSKSLIGSFHPSAILFGKLPADFECKQIETIMYSQGEKPSIRIEKSRPVWEHFSAGFFEEAIQLAERMDVNTSEMGKLKYATHFVAGDLGLYPHAFSKPCSGLLKILAFGGDHLDPNDVVKRSEILEAIRDFDRLSLGMQLFAYERLRDALGAESVSSLASFEKHFKKVAVLKDRVVSMEEMDLRDGDKPLTAEALTSVAVELRHTPMETKSIAAALDALVEDGRFFDALYLIETLPNAPEHDRLNVDSRLLEATAKDADSFTFFTVFFRLRNGEAQKLTISARRSVSARFMKEGAFSEAVTFLQENRPLRSETEHEKLLARALIEAGQLEDAARLLEALDRADTGELLALLKNRMGDHRGAFNALPDSADDDDRARFAWNAGEFAVVGRGDFHLSPLARVLSDTDEIADTSREASVAAADAHLRISAELRQAFKSALSKE